MSATASGPLTGLGVLVTRPAERAQGLAERLAAAGATALRLPTIEIQPVQPRSLPEPHDYALVLFVSPAAVTHGVAALGLSPRTAPVLGAVGPATAQALERLGFRVEVSPRGGDDSEGLLRNPSLAGDSVAGRAVLVVRGEGGREHLAAVLVERGARVDYAEVYRRVRPSRYDPGLVARCDIVSATSAEALDNLLTLVTEDERDRLTRLPLAVASARIADLARRRGFRAAIEVASGAGDDAMMQALRACAETLRSPS